MATTSLLQPPTPSNPHHTLTLSQRAAGFFKSQQSSFTLPYPLSLLSNTESQEKWAIYESLFLACLRTSDNDAAYLCLEELTDRFGRQNERVMALQGLYKEAMAGSQGELEEVLRGYDEILKEDPTVFSIRKRRAALLRSMGKVSESVQELVRLLDVSPTDAETWAELADMYAQQGLYEQAVYCLEEVLVVMPNAWNMHARLGEVFYLASQRQEGGDQLKGLSESMRRFCRSIELCDDYLRGYYGLKLTT
ncbi:tetratricopeptide repeat domain-containing protein, partial [Hortaea werneckii]